MNYDVFTVSLDFHALDFDTAKKRFSILSFGPLYRWFGILRHPTSGNLTIVMNNGAYTHEFMQTLIAPQRWNNVICAFNLNERRLIVVFNGKTLPIVTLPNNFKLEVIGSSAEATDKTVSFTEYGGGRVFHGYVNNLLLYNRSLPEKEIAQLSQWNAARNAARSGEGTLRPDRSWRRMVPTAVAAVPSSILVGAVISVVAIIIAVAIYRRRRTRRSIRTFGSAEGQTAATTLASIFTLPKELTLQWRCLRDFEP